MTITEQDLRSIYQKLDQSNLDDFMSHFAPDARYAQTDTRRAAHGSELIRIVLEQWQACFEDAHIADIVIKPARSRDLNWAGTAQCFYVDFVWVGRYVKTLPGLEGLADARGREVRLPIGDTVYFNDSGQIVRIDNTISLAALQ